MRKKIAILVPTYSGPCPEMVAALRGIYSSPEITSKYDLDLKSVSISDVGRARADLVSMVQGDHDFMIWIDDDMAPTVAQFLALTEETERSHAPVSIPYRPNDGRVMLCAGVFNGKTPFPFDPNSNAVIADWVGLGFCAIPNTKKFRSPDNFNRVPTKHGELAEDQSYWFRVATKITLLRDVGEVRHISKRAHALDWCREFSNKEIMMKNKNQESPAQAQPKAQPQPQQGGLTLDGAELTISRLTREIQAVTGMLIETLAQAMREIDALKKSTQKTT